MFTLPPPLSFSLSYNLFLRESGPLELWCFHSMNSADYIFMVQVNMFLHPPNFLQIGIWIRRLEKHWDSIHLVVWSFIRRHTVSCFLGFLMSDAIVAQCPDPLNQWGLQNNDSLVLSFHFHLLRGKKFRKGLPSSTTWLSSDLFI